MRKLEIGKDEINIGQIISDHPFLHAFLNQMDPRWQYWLRKPYTLANLFHSHELEWNQKVIYDEWHLRTFLIIDDRNSIQNL